MAAAEVAVGLGLVLAGAAAASDRWIWISARPDAEVDYARDSFGLIPLIPLLSSATLMLFAGHLSP